MLRTHPPHHYLQIKLGKGDNIMDREEILKMAQAEKYDEQELQIKKIVVAHLNHMIREEAKSETVYVQEYCKNKGIDCYVKFVDILKKSTELKIGTEECGRRERYAFFDEISEKVGANKIAIAHNLNDNAETVLMHLLRGSGISGLGGIKPYREGKFIRPLIKCDRADIENYCEEKNLQPKFDKTNKLTQEIE